MQSIRLICRMKKIRSIIHHNFTSINITYKTLYLHKMWSAEDRGSFSEVLMVSFVFFFAVVAVVAVVVICWNAETVVMRVAARSRRKAFMVEEDNFLMSKSIFLPTHIA